jgi:hypothetical protein
MPPERYIGVVDAYPTQTGCNESTEADLLPPLLQQFGAARLVVGHTPTRDLRAAARRSCSVATRCCHCRLPRRRNRAAGARLRGAHHSIQ